MKRCQLVVIGAGPAGGFAALTAARAGLEVLLLERGEVVGQPLACAEAVAHYGFSQFIEPDPSFVSAEVTSIAFTVSNGYRYCHDFDYIVGYVLDRPEFDRRLSEMAVQAGADLRLNSYACGIRISENGPAEVEVEDKGGRKTIKADYVIAADGVESMVGRMAGLETGLKLNQSDTTLQYRVTDINVEAHCVDFYVGKSYAPSGYLWVFPKSGSSANIGLGLNPARYAGNKLKGYLDKFLKGKFPSYKVMSTHCGNVPKFIGSRIFGRENLLLAGDASRALDSTTGAGITKALHTGQLAARAVVRAVAERQTNTALQKNYRRMINSQIGSELRFSQKIYPLVRKFSEGDWETLIQFLRKFVEKEKAGSRIDPVVVVKSAFATAPRLMKLARHIL